MNELIAWIIGVVLIVSMFGSIVYEYNKKQSRSLQEYEEEIESKGIKQFGNALMKAGFLEMEKMLKPNLENAVAFIEDEKQGQTNHKEEGEGNGEESEKNIPDQTCADEEKRD
jgi:hypothetical protein